MSATASATGQVYRCAWCHKAEPVSGGLLFYTYTDIDAAGHRTAAAGDPARWSHSDGICPAHLAAAR
ncbi:MAG TPA: hypothetical protein VII06_24995 [Chloroflexota bacterium]|jgi:hypothetical protein